MFESFPAAGFQLPRLSLDWKRLSTLSFIAAATIIMGGNCAVKSEHGTFL